MFNSRNIHLLNQLVRVNLKNSVQFKSSPAIEEIRIPVPWGHIAGKWWGPTDRRPILTLHGWQDNCGSFGRLIPLLSKDIGFLVIDYPGHGHSSRLPSGMYYFYTNYLILVQYLVNYFQWPKVSLMGHSLGGITGFTYSLLYPQNVDFLICIDGAKPTIVENNIAKMAKKIRNFSKYVQHEMSDEEPPSYTMDEIIEKICAPNDNAVYVEHSHHVIERNIAPSKNFPGKYFFTRDPRLKVHDLMNFPQEESMAFAQSLTCPVFIAKAIGGSYYEAMKYFYQVLDVVKKSSVDCQYHRLEGTHYLHLNNPEVLAELINQFIEKHDRCDRAVGGIKHEMRQ